MKPILLTLLILLTATHTYGQKLDHTWIISQDGSSQDNIFGRMVLRFDTSPPSVQQDFSVESMDMFLSNATMSDSLGNLLFYTNGCDIADPAGNILPNGDELSPGVHHDILCH